MADATLEKTIEGRPWEARASISDRDHRGGGERTAVDAALELLDSGMARVATRGGNGEWTVHQWLKKRCC